MAGKGPNSNNILFVEGEYGLATGPAAVCWGVMDTNFFNPFMVISADNITIRMSAAERSLPARLVKKPE